MNQQNENQLPQPPWGLMVRAVLCLGLPWRTMMAQWDTVGPRQSGGMGAVFGFLSLLGWTLFWPSEGMVGAFGLYLLAQIAHRLRPGREHSHSIGTTPLGWPLTHLLAVGLGLTFIIKLDRSLGSWLVASGGMNLVLFWLLRLKETAIRTDMQDALHEARYRRGM